MEGTWGEKTLLTENTNSPSIDYESGGPGYAYGIIGWIGIIPFILMFIVPVIVYGGKVNISTIYGVYGLTTSTLLYALLVFSSWLGIAALFAGIGMRLFKTTSELAYWPLARLESIFRYCSIIGAVAFVCHQFVIFPPLIENFVHLLSMTAYWGLGLGICLLFDPRYAARDGRGHRLFLTVVLFLLLTLIPIVLGKASSVAAAGVAVIVALYIIRSSIATKIVAILLAGGLVAAGMTWKTMLRQVLYEGGIYQRQNVVNYLLNRSHVNSEDILKNSENVLKNSEDVPKNSEIVLKPCSFGTHKGLVSNIENGSAFVTCADAMANALESDKTAFSKYDQNSENIIIPREILGDHLHFSVARVVHRLNHLGLLGHVMASTPSIVPSWGGSTYQSLLFVAIPRAVWSDKPDVGVANLFGRQYGLLWPADRETTVNVDPVTEAWMNGGWSAVLFSSAGIGLLIGGILGWLGSGGQQHIRFLVALTVALHVALFESETALIIGGLVQGLVFLGAIVITTRLSNKGRLFLFSERAS